MMMRKLLNTLALLTVIAAMSSCERYTRVVVDETAVQNVGTVTFTVRQSDWEYSNLDNNNFFSVRVKMPEITRDVFNYGMIKVYRAYDFNADGSNTSAYQIELPYVRHHEVLVGKDLWADYTETVDYDFEIGYITIYYTVSDFNYELDTRFVPDQMQFRCVMLL